jgi:hypothetical protein
VVSSDRQLILPAMQDGTGSETILFHQTQQSKCSHYQCLKTKAEPAFETLCLFNLDDGHSPKIIQSGGGISTTQSVSRTTDITVQDGFTTVNSKKVGKTG